VGPMNITRTEVKLKASDLMSMIEDYVNIPNLNITEIIVKDSIRIEGIYKFLKTMNFSVLLSMQSYDRVHICFKIEKVKVVKVGVFNWIKKFILKKLFEKLNLNGVFGEGDTVKVHINKVLELLPIYLRLDLSSCEIIGDTIEVSAENIVFKMSKGIGVNGSINELEGVVSEEVLEVQPIKKVEDNYTTLREKIESKVPDRFDRIIEYAFLLPDMIALFYRIFKDKRVPVKTKVIVGGVIGYLVSPIDILPDFVPFIGKLDDLAIAFYALDKVINQIPPEIILENWQGDLKSIKKIQQGLAYIHRAAGGGNVERLVSFAEKAYEFSKEERSTKKEID
jgi:uncharacterized membrane protein YkvA (DUF1232 family)